MSSSILTVIARRLWLASAFALAALPTALWANVSVGLICTNGPTFALKTATGFISTPDSGSTFMWGYTTSNGAFQAPGPVLCVTEGQTVNITLTNNLPEPVSIVFPGQTGVTATGDIPAPPALGGGLFTAEAAAGSGSATYSFKAGLPGTYLYESGTNPHKQVQMGLYGVLVVRPALGATYAYDDPRTRFDPNREYLLAEHEIDPFLHEAVRLNHTYDVTKLLARYWTINGRGFPDTILDNRDASLPSQPYGALVRVQASDPASPNLPALIRFVNAGMANHPFHPHGNHVRVIARDGRLLHGPNGEDTSMLAFAKTLGSGETADLLFGWNNVDAWTPTGNPVPVTIPGNQNLTFKDNATFYSGSPYLGKKGALPTAVVSFNECGEFYFPAHSHALHEFTNFNEGFGGLATLFRVDPPPNLTTLTCSAL